MQGFLTVFRYTFFENARKKSFVVSTSIILFLTVVVICIPGIINYFENSKKSNTESANISSSNKSIIYIIDSKEIYKDNIPDIKSAFPNYEVKVKTSADISEVKEIVRKSKTESLIEIDEKEGIPYFNYWVKQYNSGGLKVEEISRGLKNIFTVKLLKNAKVSDVTTSKILRDVNYNLTELGKGVVKGYIASYFIIILLFMAIYFFSYGISMSVASEKTSRVMEILLTSTKPSRIIIGKSAAMGLLGLCQLFLVVGTSFVTYSVAFPKDFKIGGMSIDLSSFTPMVIIMVFLYFILGYSLFAMLNAVAGSSVSKAEDVNSAIMPVSMISMISFYLAYGSVFMPDGGLAIAASIIPFSAPFSMPSRLLMSEVPWWQIAISITLLVTTIIIAASISIRIYSKAVLHYGKRLKINDLVKISKDR